MCIRDRLETKYNGGGSWSNFEETVSLYHYIDTLDDEGDEIDLPEYLAKALVYYVKARLFEDTDPSKTEYFMKEFHAIIGKHEKSKIWGARMVSPGPNAIR